MEGDDGVGEDTEHGRGLSAMLQRVSQEIYGVTLLGKTRGQLCEMAARSDMSVEDVASLEVGDLRAYLIGLRADQAGSYAAHEERRFERWATGLVEGNEGSATRTALQGALGAEGDGVQMVSVGAPGATAAEQFKARVTRLAVVAFPDMAEDATALEACVATCVGNGLEPLQVVGLSASLELGQVVRVSANDVMGGSFKSDSRNLAVVKAVAKYNQNTMTKTVERKDVRELVAHLTDLARDFAAQGDAIQAVLVSSFLSEGQVAFMSDAKGFFLYVKAYFRVYPGQGIPVVFDDRMATRARNESREATPSLSKAEITQLLRIEMAGQMAEMGRQAGRGRGLGRGGDRAGAGPLTGDALAAKLAKTKCFKCQKKGHFARDCPEEADGGVEEE